jgi:hypothetical protein
VGAVRCNLRVGILHLHGWNVAFANRPLAMCNKIFHRFSRLHVMKNCSVREGLIRSWRDEHFESVDYILVAGSVKRSMISPKVILFKLNWEMPFVSSWHNLNQRRLLRVAWHVALVQVRGCVSEHFLSVPTGYAKQSSRFRGMLVA